MMAVIQEICKNDDIAEIVDTGEALRALQEQTIEDLEKIERLGLISAFLDENSDERPELANEIQDHLSAEPYEILQVMDEV